jgi:hypothetical protein
MKPEHRGCELFNNRDEPVSASDMKQFVARDPVLPCGTQSQKGLRQENYGSKEPNRCGASDFTRNTKESASLDAIAGQLDRIREENEGHRRESISANLEHTGGKPSQSQHEAGQQNP